ncbi:MAG: type I phosphomannose isomerase catalytic subunit [Candidatus Borkfalkiaceae bacterium]|nr:type I phosphomannose isomerase catalytic subunit [Christensenellaceae bacterium]
MKNVYKLVPEYKDYLWGGEKLKTDYGKQTDKTPCAESWELSLNPHGLTKVEDGKTLAEVLTPEKTGKNCEKFEFFPVLIKFIDAKQNLSVQVHPSDDYALKYENSYGKTESWYIVEAEEGAGIYCGFKRDTNKEEFLQSLASGEVEKLLNFIPVKKGDCYFIPSGTVHAIGAGCLILEIQQNSDLTYRVYDYNRRGADGKLRELHVDKAVKVINFNKYEPKLFASGENPRVITECDYFRSRELVLNGGFTEKNANSFTCVTVTDGSGEISGEKFVKGDSFFVCADTEYTLKGTGKVILTCVP